MSRLWVGPHRPDRRFQLAFSRRGTHECPSAESLSSKNPCVAALVCRARQTLPNVILDTNLAMWPRPAPICHAPHVAMAPHLTPQVAEGSILMGPTLATYQEVLAEAENSTPVAGSTNCRPIHPREEPRALTGLRGSGRGVTSNGNPYRDLSTWRFEILTLPR